MWWRTEYWLCFNETIDKLSFLINNQVQTLYEDYMKGNNSNTRDLIPKGKAYSKRNIEESDTANIDTLYTVFKLAHFFFELYQLLVAKYPVCPGRIQKERNTNLAYSVVYCIVCNESGIRTPDIQLRKWNLQRCVTYKHTWINFTRLRLKRTCVE